MQNYNSVIINCNTLSAVLSVINAKNAVPLIFAVEAKHISCSLSLFFSPDSHLSALFVQLTVDGFLICEFVFPIFIPSLQ